MIYLIGNAPDSPRYKRIYTLEIFLDWLRPLPAYQLDIETNMTPWWCDKKLITLQFGSMDGKEQWVIQWSFLDIFSQGILARWLNDHSKLKVIHNAMFECVVLLFYGIRITNVYDTMLAEMVLNCGMQFKAEEIEDDETEEAAGFYALTSLQYRYLCKGMDKTEQTNFGDDILTEAKVIYAATDVMPLGAIRRMQLPELSRWDLEFVAGLEMEAVLGFAEMVYEGMELDQDAWRANIQLALPIIAKAKSELDHFLTSDLWEFRQYALDKGYFSENDMITINWNSPQQKKQAVDHYFPFLKDRCSKTALKHMLKNSFFSDPMGDRISRAFLDGNYTHIETIMLQADKHWLIDNHYLIPAGETTINWNSVQQVLPVFKIIKRGLKNLDDQALSRIAHPIAKALKDYRSALKLITTYGETFITGKPNPKRKQDMPKVEPDGKVRTSFNQIVSTGRVSSRGPNMQNIPVKDPVGNRYRNCFVCDTGWVFVSSDFASQELVEMAYLSQEPVWMEAIEKGWDLHSICAGMLYKKKWVEAADPDCEYYKSKQKCNCNKHKVMRYNAKTVNFGVPYGMAAYKLSAELKVPVKVAEQLLDEYAKTFPKLWNTLRYLQRFGVKNGYIMTLAPFYRKRWFPYWKYHQAAIEMHLAGQWDPNLGAIEREAGNMPIQGSAGDMCKAALVLIYNYKWEHNLPVKLKMQVHDQIDTVATKEYAPTWVPIMDQLMRDAALLIIPNGLLRADTQISAQWAK